VLLVLHHARSFLVDALALSLSLRHLRLVRLMHRYPFLTTAAAWSTIDAQLATKWGHYEESSPSSLLAW